MPEVTVNIEIYCDKCGAGLCNQSTFVKTRVREEPSFRVQPCEKCMDEARDEGYQDGHQVGFQEARDQFEEA